MPESVLTGSIQVFRLADVLTFLSTARKSGTLTLAHDANEAYLYFNDGALVFAGSNQEPFRLGSILLRKKKISREQRDRIDALMQREGGRFGQFAVQEGALTEGQLRDFLKIQVSEIVYDAFVWDGGTFTFVQDFSLPPHAVTIAIDLPNLIMEGARRIDEWEQCLELLPDKSIVFRVVATPRDEKITLTADEWKILFLINGQRTLEELSHEGEEDAFQVYRVVYGLLANKLIEPVNRTSEDTDASHRTGAVKAVTIGDATVRQDSPRFGAESTVRDEAGDDDTSLLVSVEARLSYADVVRPTIAQLAIASGEHAGKQFPLSEPEYLIGRHRDNTIQLADLGVSGFHSRIYRGPDGYVLEDLKSRNGTWVNGMRVFHTTLAHGDKVHIGQTDLLYELLF
ncbi:MAG TPA: DUF4388 domain-containing protein [Thermoanaerobaculia bacterium]|nr:DUF4388 domain-containing protein [Thermoanaerobaculia bacterium]